MAKLSCPKIFELPPLQFSDCSVSVNMRALLAPLLPFLTIDFCIGRPFWRLSCSVRSGMSLMSPAMLRAGFATGSFQTSIQIFSLLPTYSTLLTKLVHAHALYAYIIACTNLMYAFRLQMNKLAYARLLCYISFRSVIMP